MKTINAARLATLGVGLAILAAACASSSTDNENATPTSTPSTRVDSTIATDALPAGLQVQATIDLPCPGQLVDPPADFEQVLDVVALPAAPTYPHALQMSAREADDGTRFYFAKTGLWWRGNAAFEIVVPPEFRPRMAIGWGGPAEHSYRVQAACGLSDNQWMVMAGGYWVTEPMCASVIVKTPTDEKRVDIGLGQTCASQNPSAGPSDG